MGHDREDGVAALPHLSARGADHLGELEADGVDVDETYHVADVLIRVAVTQPQALSDVAEDLVIVPGPLLGTGPRVLQVVHQLIGAEPAVAVLVLEEQQPEDGDRGVGGAGLLGPDLLPDLGPGQQPALLHVTTAASTDLITHREPAAFASVKQRVRSSDPMRHLTLTCSHWSPPGDTAGTRARSCSWGRPPCPGPPAPAPGEICPEWRTAPGPCLATRPPCKGSSMSPGHGLSGGR